MIDLGIKQEKTEAAIAEIAQQNEAEIGALNDAVDDIDARIDQHLEAEDFALDDDDPDLYVFESDGTVDLTTVPYVVDQELWLNEARVIGGKLHVGSLLASILASAAQEIFKNNDIQLFDLDTDPDEMHNLAVEPEKNRATILRMNGLLNDLMAKEVGVNDGRFLPQDIRPK